MRSAIDCQTRGRDMRRKSQNIYLGQCDLWLVWFLHHSIEALWIGSWWKELRYPSFDCDTKASTRDDPVIVRVLYFGDYKLEFELELVKATLNQSNDYLFLYCRLSPNIVITGCYMYAWSCNVLLDVSQARSLPTIDSTILMSHCQANQLLKTSSTGISQVARLKWSNYLWSSKYVSGMVWDDLSISVNL